MMEAKNVLAKIGQNFHEANPEHGAPWVKVLRFVGRHDREANLVIQSMEELLRPTY